MKKLIWILAVGCILCTLLLSTAQAEEDFTITKQAYFINADISETSHTVYFDGYARVDNNSDTPLTYDSCLFEFKDSAGNVVYSSNFIVNLMPTFLMPGEYGYLSLSSWTDVENVENYGDITEMSISLTLREPYSFEKTYSYFHCTETSWVPDESDNWIKENYMTAVFTNTTEELVFCPDCVFAVLDEDDRPVYVIRLSGKNESISIHPGSALTYRKNVSDTVLERFEEYGIESVRVDAIFF